MGGSMDMRTRYGVRVTRERWRRLELTTEDTEATKEVRPWGSFLCGLRVLCGALYLGDGFRRADANAHGQVRGALADLARTAHRGSLEALEGHALID